MLDPISAAIAGTVATAAGAAATALAQVFNGHMGRKEQRADREQRHEHHVQSRTDAAERFELDFDLRHDRFVWEKGEAQAAIIRRALERMEEFRRQDVREQRGRSYNGLSRIFNASPDAFFIQDPHARSYPGVKSLRLLAHVPTFAPEICRLIENDISQAVHGYMQNSEGTPISFPTGIWKPGAPVGSWIAPELRLWDPDVPSLILRADAGLNNKLHIYGDMFGFPIGNRDYEQNIAFGQVPKDPQIIHTVLSFIAMSVADIYYLSNYGRMPQLPRIITAYLQQAGTAALMGTFVQNYQDTINALLAEKPTTGIPMALQFAKSLTGLADNVYAIRQTRAVEKMTEHILPNHPQLIERLSELYEATGCPQDVARLRKIVVRSVERDRTARRTLLENVL